MKLFVLLSRVPYPLEKGDKLRAFNQIKLLAAHHEIHLCCLSDKPLHPDAEIELKKICSHLQVIQLRRWEIYLSLFIGLFSDKPFQVHYFYQHHAQRKINEALDQFKPDFIYCQLIRVTEYVKEKHEYFKVLDYMDALSKGVSRRVDKVSPLLRPFFRTEHRRLVAYENIMFEYFERKTIISKQDRDLIFHPERKKIAIIPNGIDLSYFKPIEKPEQTYDIVFHGNMSYPPNVDAAEFLAHEILPLVHKSVPTATLLISGATPSPSVEALSNTHITVSGWIDDIRKAYASGKVFVAPMRIGTGLQNKLLEAMAMETPCVTSTLANNALGACPNEEILVADNTEGIAEHIIRLLKNPQDAAAIAKKGKGFIQREYNETAIGEKLNQLFQKDKIKNSIPEG